MHAPSIANAREMRAKSGASTDVEDRRASIFYFEGSQKTLQQAQHSCAFELMRSSLTLILCKSSATSLKIPPPCIDDHQPRQGKAEGKTVSPHLLNYLSWSWALSRVNREGWRDGGTECRTPPPDAARCTPRQTARDGTKSAQSTLTVFGLVAARLAGRDSLTPTT